MPTQSDSSTPQPDWQARHVYTLAAICLLAGLAVGYLVRGSASLSTDNPAGPPKSSAKRQEMPSLEQMKQMADKQAQPLLIKLKSDPNNAALLVEIADAYKSAHQFKQAADYYARSLDIDPRNVAIRTDMASCLYYAGDADAALAELAHSLEYAPADADALFNTGMIRWKGKTDVKGAVAAWQELLKKNPTLEAQKKAEVERLIADATRLKRNQD